MRVAILILLSTLGLLCCNRRIPNDGLSVAERIQDTSELFGVAPLIEPLSACEEFEVASPQDQADSLVAIYEKSILSGNEIQNVDWAFFCCFPETFAEMQQIFGYHDDYIKHMVVKGDDDNRLFFENIVFTSERYKEAEPLTKILKDSATTEEEKKKARESYDAIHKKVMEYHNSIIEKYPTTVTARLLRMNRPIDVPEAPQKADGTIDEQFQYRYYRKHYFDNYNLGDELTLRQAKVAYWDKVSDYLDRLFIQQADTLTKAADQLIGVAAASKNTYRFLVWKLIGHYQSSNIMGLDEVYVNLVDKYIATGEMDYWLDEKTVKNLIDDVDKVRRAMIGRTAPNMVMQNENFQRRGLYDLKTKYSIVYFFKPSCGHCREETPKLVKFYNQQKKRFDLEVFAVSTDTTMSELRDFIKEMKTDWITVCGPRSYSDKHFSNMYYAERTPTVYILDEKKKIIARKLDVEQIEDFLANYEKMTTRHSVTESRGG